jgi:hypothetical protein
MVNAMRNAKRKHRLPDAQLRRGEYGQTLLEFALLLPFMILLAVGVVELGRAVYYTVAVNNAATAGAEYGSQSEAAFGDNLGITNTARCDANGGSPPSCQSGILTASNVTVTQGCRCDDSNLGISCNPMPAAGSCAGISCTQTVKCLQVQTTATYTPLFNYPGLPSSYTANGKAVMRARH